MRPSGRAPDEMRAISFEPHYTKHAEGSVLVSFGHTKVICTASVEERLPPWLRGKGEGWVTAEYSMLPRATHTRGSREAAKGKQSGRTQEIQRLIGRSLRAVVDMKKLGERQITLDCDVIQADGGTRTAAISGAWVALRIAVDKLMAAGAISDRPCRLSGQRPPRRAALYTSALSASSPKSAMRLLSHRGISVPQDSANRATRL